MYYIYIYINIYLYIYTYIYNVMCVLVYYIILNNIDILVSSNDRQKYLFCTNL